MTKFWSCGTCGDADVPEKFRIFGSCYKCASQRSIDKRNRKIKQLQGEVKRLTFHRTRTQPLEYNGELFSADLNCKHEIYAKMTGGIKCRKCPGWFCY